MDKKTLMIGDWVYNTHNKQNEQVQEIGNGLVMLDYNDIYEYDEIEPIPLTSEILEKNGFEYKEREIGMYGVTTAPHYICDGVPFEVFCDGEPFAIWFKEPINIKYIHQLQQALKLCGITKEIRL